MQVLTREEREVITDLRITTLLFDAMCVEHEKLASAASLDALHVLQAHVPDHMHEEVSEYIADFIAGLRMPSEWCWLRNHSQALQDANIFAREMARKANTIARLRRKAKHMSILPEGW